MPIVPPLLGRASRRKWDIPEFLDMLRPDEDISDCWWKMLASVSL